MPSGDISEAKYLLPIVDNAIDGYYDIERISFGTRTKVANDGSTIPGFPTLRIKLGVFHPFDRSYSEGIVPRMANQIWDRAILQSLKAKSHPYFSAESEEISIAEEPEAQYGYFLIEHDYIDAFDRIK